MSAKKVLEQCGGICQIDRITVSRNEPTWLIPPRLGRQPGPQRRPVANHEERGNPVDSQAGCRVSDPEEQREQRMRGEPRHVEDDVGDILQKTLRRANLDQGFAGPEIRQLDEGDVLTGESGCFAEWSNPADAGNLCDPLQGLRRRKHGGPRETRLPGCEPQGVKGVGGDERPNGCARGERLETIIRHTTRWARDQQTPAHIHRERGRGAGTD